MRSANGIGATLGMPAACDERSGARGRLPDGRRLRDRTRTWPWRLLSLCFGFTQFTEGAFWSASTYVAGPHTATATGVMNTGGNAAGFLAPVVGLMVDQLGWLATLASGSIFALTGAVLWLFIGERAGATIAGALGIAGRIDPRAWLHLGTLDADEMAVRQ